MPTAQSSFASRDYIKYTHAAWGHDRGVAGLCGMLSHLSVVGRALG